MSVASSLGNIGTTAVGETLGPEFGKLVSALQDSTKGLQGWNSALSSGTSALKGFAAASNPSGTKPLSEAFELLAASVGVVVLPGMVLLAAGVMTAAQIIREDLRPALGDVAKWYAENVPAMAEFAKEVANATIEVGKWAAHLIKTGELETLTDKDKGSDSAKRIGDLDPRNIGRYIGEEYGNARIKAALDQAIQAGGHGQNQFGHGDLQFVGPPENTASGSAVSGSPAGIDPKNFVGPPAPAGHMDKFLDNAEMILKQMEVAQGGAPGFSSIADAWKKAQSSAFESPMQAMMRQFHQENIGVLKEQLIEARKANQTPNAVRGGNATAGR